MGIEVTIQLDRQRIGFIIRYHPDIGPAVIVAIGSTSSLNFQGISEIGMDFRLSISLEVQALSICHIRSTLGCRLQVTDRSSMVQRIPFCLGQFRAIQAAQHIGDLLTAIGQAVGGQFHLAIRAAVLRRNGNALAVNHGSSTARTICESRLVQVQILIQSNHDSFVGRIHRGGQVVVTTSGNLDGLAEILLDLRCLRAVSIVCTETKAAARGRAIDNGLGHILELIFRSRPAADDIIGIPFRIGQASDIIPSLGIRPLARSAYILRANLDSLLACFRCKADGAHIGKVLVQLDFQTVTSIVLHHADITIGQAASRSTARDVQGAVERRADGLRRVRLGIITGKFHAIIQGSDGMECLRSI